MVTESVQLRAWLVEGLQERGLLRTREVERAFLAVERERFLPEVARERGLAAVYADEAIVIKRDVHGRPISSSSQPAMMAVMLELLDVRPGQRVLEIGTGTGYNAALLARLTGEEGEVISTDIDPALAAQAARALREARVPVDVVTMDARARVPGGPFDRIIVTASAGQIPRAWLEGLREGGRLELPLQVAGLSPQLIPVLERRGACLELVDWTWGGFMPLHGGDGGWGAPGPALTAGTSSRSLVAVQGQVVATLADGAAAALLADLLTQPGQLAAHGQLDEPEEERTLLELFLAAVLPPERRVILTRDGQSLIGFLDPADASLAALEVPPRQGPGRPEWRLLAWSARGEAGAGSAPARIRAPVQRWLGLDRAARRPHLVARDTGAETLELAFAGWTPEGG